MARASFRVCAEPGCPTMGPDALCPVHRAERDAHQRRTVPTKMVEPGDRARRAAAVREHRARHGDWCPGWRSPPHPATDLTADDVVPVMDSGRPSAELVVRCRSCNSRRGAWLAAAARKRVDDASTFGRARRIRRPS